MVFLELHHKIITHVSKYRPSMPYIQHEYPPTSRSEDVWRCPRDSQPASSSTTREGSRAVHLHSPTLQRRSHPIPEPSTTDTEYARYQLLRRMDEIRFPRRWLLQWVESGSRSSRRPASIPIQRQHIQQRQTASSRYCRFGTETLDHVRTADHLHHREDIPRGPQAASASQESHKEDYVNVFRMAFGALRYQLPRKYHDLMISIPTAILPSTYLLTTPTFHTRREISLTGAHG